MTSLPDYPDHYLFKPREAADILRVSLDTLRDWRSAGKIRATPLGKHTFRYAAREVRKILEER